MIMVQPVASHAPRRRPPSSTGVQWTTGLFDCHQDLHNEHSKLGGRGGSGMGFRRVRGQEPSILQTI
ncbi:unnamed protein product [Cuscuta campestris]|uniref:Uncharacterized protein n=1 Tax=Cuscuta campestris TaxID=132261 RepID=A0A484MXP3_9ASTE|nr:unnamed protein product [Cuscuta campestris]